MTTKQRLIFLYNHGIPLTEFARRIKCDKTTLAKWVRDESNLSSKLEHNLEMAINEYLSELNEIRT